MKIKYPAVCSLLLGSCFLLVPLPLKAVPPRPLGDSKVLTPVPALPGYPEGISVHEGLVYVSGPAAVGVPGNFMPSKIFAYDEDLNPGCNVATGKLHDRVCTAEGCPCMRHMHIGEIYIFFKCFYTFGPDNI
jgi:hypothetical protein